VSTNDLDPRDSHSHADRAGNEPAEPSDPLEVNSNLIMIAFMIGSVALLALVSLWVLARFSPQALELGIRSGQTTAAAPSPAPTAQLTPTPTPLPIAVPSAMPPNLWTASLPARSPSPGRTTALATAIVDRPLPAAEATPASPMVKGSAPSTSGAPTASPTPTATAASTVPRAPTNATATAGNRSAAITWTAPSDGGSAITSYTITPYLGATAQPPTVITGSPPVTGVTVTGLRNGTTYTFTVTATNSIGTGPPSVQTNPVTPPH